MLLPMIFWANAASFVPASLRLLCDADLWYDRIIGSHAQTNLNII